MRTKRTHGNRQKTLALRRLERLRNIGKVIKRSQDKRGKVKTTKRISNRLSFNNIPRRLLLRLFQLLNRRQLLKNNSFSRSPKTPNCSRNQSLYYKRVQRFSLRQKYFSINNNSFARSLASSAQALFNFFCKDNFCLSTQSPGKDLLGTLQDSKKKRLTVILGHKQATLEILFNTATAATRDNIHQTICINPPTT